MRASRYAKPGFSRGFSLIELLVAVSILSILAAVALPYAKHGRVRAQEVELRQTLRTLRTAIDNFHRDCEDGDIGKSQTGVSRNCYPETLDVLVEGVQTRGADDGIKRYLRRIPKDPFQAADTELEEHWLFRSYEDDIDSSIWGEEDVYDIRVNHDKQALDGSYYKQW